MSLYDRASQIIAGRTHLFGRRAELHALGICPIYSDRQMDGHLWDVDGNKYIDLNMGTGAVLLGHAYPAVVRAVQDQAALGTGLTLNHPLEIETAELLCDMVPCADMVRFCKGGGEANMVAIRIARAATRRDKVLFCGYHGWHDWYLAASLCNNSALDRHLLPGITPLGVPQTLKETTFPFEYNNLSSLRILLEAHRGEVACVIMEAARLNTPTSGFLEEVRSLTQASGVLLIFDEVVTGFRLARGGAQAHFNVIPDMATFAKCISNGFAFGAVAGRRDVMTVALDSFISSVYWAEATGLAAANATMREYRRQDVCGIVRRLGDQFTEGLRVLVDGSGVPLRITGLPSFPSLAFKDLSPSLSNQLLTLFMQETAKRGILGGLLSFFALDTPARTSGRRWKQSAKRWQ